MNNKDKLFEFSAYGVKISHPLDWNIVINPNRKFTFDVGLVKIEDTKDIKNHPVSLVIRWANISPNSNLEGYVNELKTQYKLKKKKSKNKDQYKILKKEKVSTIYENEAYIIHSRYTVNHSVYRFWGQNEEMDTLQLCTISHKTNRILVASLVTKPEILESDQGFYTKLLKTGFIY